MFAVAFHEKPCDRTVPAIPRGANPKSLRFPSCWGSMATWKKANKKQKKHGEPTGTNYFFRSPLCSAGHVCLEHGGGRRGRRRVVGLARRRSGRGHRRALLEPERSNPKVHHQTQPMSMLFLFLLPNAHQLLGNKHDAQSSFFTQKHNRWGWIPTSNHAGGVNMFKAALVCEKPPNVHPKAA